MWFLYDESGNSVGFTLNGTEYYYIKNLQGDITAIADASGTIVAKYTYDVWGKILSITDANGVDVSADSTHIANINPLRYRGYYYDSETGLYYLLSRYYDPETGRFVNSDNVISGTGNSVQGFNLYVYCFNNPVNLTDETGNWPTWNRIKQRVKSFLLDFMSDYCKVSPSPVKYDVPLYDQGSTKLCWAYSQTMIDSYKANTKLNDEDADAYAKELAVNLHGKDKWDQGGSPQNKKSTIAAEKITDINVLSDILKDNGPVYARYANDESGHAVVITGVSVFSNTVYTNNPWGIRGKQTFEDFKDGFATRWYYGPANMTLDKIYVLE